MKQDAWKEKSKLKSLSHWLTAGQAALVLRFMGSFIFSGGQKEVACSQTPYVINNAGQLETR